MDYRCKWCGATVPKTFVTALDVTHFKPGTQTKCEPPAGKGPWFVESKDTDTSRFVFVSDEWGIYLGDGKWSGINPGGTTSAPTFVNPLSSEDKPKPPEGEFLRHGLQRVVVESDLPDNRASIDACINAGLLRWNPNAEKTAT